MQTNTEDPIATITIGVRARDRKTIAKFLIVRVGAVLAFLLD